MSDEKHQQLIDAGQLHPDGARIEVCPTCLRPMPEGEHLPSQAVAVTPAGVVVGVTADEPGSEG